MYLLDAGEQQKLREEIEDHYLNDTPKSYCLLDEVYYTIFYAAEEIVIYRSHNRNLNKVTLAKREWGNFDAEEFCKEYERDYQRETKNEQ